MIALAFTVAVTVISAGEAWDCEGDETYEPFAGCVEPHRYDVCYDTEAASYVDDGQCFDVPEWCWADGKDTL